MRGLIGSGRLRYRACSRLKVGSCQGVCASLRGSCIAVNPTLMSMKRAMEKGGKPTSEVLEIRSRA